MNSSLYAAQDLDVLTRDIAVYLVNGESLTFGGVDFDSLSYFSQDGIAWLRFKAYTRFVVVPNVQYWTEG